MSGCSPINKEEDDEKGIVRYTVTLPMCHYVVTLPPLDASLARVILLGGLCSLTSLNQKTLCEGCSFGLKKFFITGKGGGEFLPVSVARECSSMKLNLGL